jgi:hypothetical protein
LIETAKDKADHEAMERITVSNAQMALALAGNERRRHGTKPL